MNKYWKPDITADLIILNQFNEILLMKRNTKPFKNYWVIPGGFMDEKDKSLKETAIREAKEELQIDIKSEVLFLTILDQIDRDPRKRIISNVFYTVVDKKINFQITEEASDIQWFSLDKLPKIGFDHIKAINLIPKRFKLGLDVHGVIDTFPEKFINLAKIIRNNGGEVHIITGARDNEILNKKLLNYNNGVKWWDFIFSLSDESLKSKNHWIDNDGFVWNIPEEWNSYKGNYAKQVKLDLHFDNSKEYEEYFPEGVFNLINWRKK